MNRRILLIVMCLVMAIGAIPLVVEQGQAAPVLNPAVDLSKPNFAYSPPLRKFIDSLPGICGVGTTNGLGQCIPLATAGVLAGHPGDDYYEIALVEYREQLHRDLPAVTGTWPNQTGGTKLRGYVQLVQGTTNFVTPPHYLGPLILATKNKPVRIKFVNMLPTGVGGNLFLPVDTTIMGAGEGPLTAGGAPCDPATQVCASYTQNRATMHLHGGLPPWISDGTAHQWITPAGETTPFVKGASMQNVPDMAIPANGSATFYWTNQQSGRLMFYHDHALGLTGLNVYAGEAAGYLLVDPVEETALAALGVPGTTADLAHLIPLIIQDKTFVSTATTTVTDPLWNTAAWGAQGSLWFPHVYQPNQDPTDPSGANPLGRWDYGPWFWPVFPVASPYPPTVSHVPEAFMDTPLVNGTAYPYINVAAAPYRLKILNACNDRMVNLQMYQADSGYTTPATATALILNGSVSSIGLTNQGTGYKPNSSPMVHIVGGGGVGAWATATVNALGNVASVVVTAGGSGYTSAPAVYIGGSTEVKMVPAVQNAAIPFPPVWLTQTPGMIPDILDSRLSGVPDPSLRGPAMVQIATEGGLLPGPVVIPNTPVGFEQNKRNIVVLNVLEKSLFMAPAERADVIVDFSQFAGKTIILYNDSPAPVPASDPRYDFYTGNPDYSATGGANDQGGAPSTLPGFGPNTRTIMQIRVAGVDSGVPGPVDAVPTAIVTALTTSLPAIFKATQDVPVVPESAYNGLLYSGGSTSDTYATISAHNLTFTPYGSTTQITQAMKNPTIQELFDPEGRMNATLGVELPFTGALIQTTVPLGFTDPTTETLASGKTQIWKITHNGVDTHGIHFHLVNVQVINRVGWDGAIRTPDDNELGWKDTVRMNPLEDIIVAMRAKTPTFPFAVPDSIRPLAPALPVGATMASLDPLTGQPITITNDITNFGNEYTWHCHILGHEENDMMRPLVLMPNAYDFNRDQNVDILLKNINNGQSAIWYMNSTAYSSDALLSKPVGVGAGWQIVGAGDFGNLILENSNTGQVSIWKMNGITYQSDTMVSQTVNIAAGWSIVATGDFDGDGKADFVLQNSNSGQVAIWLMDGSTYKSDAVLSQTLSFAGGWRIVGAGDFNGDGQDDILLQNANFGQVAVWFMNGTTYASDAVLAKTFNTAGGWNVVGTGDFNKDSKADIVLQNSNNGQIAIWLMNGTAFVSDSVLSRTSAVASGWRVAGPH